MATFQLFFQSDRAKDLSTPLYTHGMLCMDLTLSLENNCIYTYIGQSCDSCHEPLMMGTETASDMDTRFIFAWPIS